MGRYILTGAAGFIGSRVADLLLRDGHSVLGVDNLSAAYDVRMKDYRLQGLLRREGFKFLKADISERATMDEIAALWPQADGLINLAAMAGVRASTSDPWAYLSTNTLGMLNMLELARRQGIMRVVSASTSSVYGDLGRPPHKEEASSDHPLSPYAASKKGAEAFGYAYHHLYGLDLTMLRYFTVYGPAGRPDMVMFRFCQWINEGKPVYTTGDGNQSRGFTYVEDIARGTLLALEKSRGYQIYNLGGHEVITINQLIRMLEARLGKKADVQYIPAHPADMLSNQADVSKARQELGWEPQVGLEEGVGKLVDWYLENREWAREIETP